MKTAEVAIEHVLTGVLALCAFLLPLLSGLSINERMLKSEILVGVVGMAYLFGVVFDKLADTILSPIEQWLRLGLANEFLEKNGPRYDEDPFPQDVLEYCLRGDKNGRVDWMDSLRSRIRTSRGLAVLGLPAAMGIAIYLTAGPNSEVRWSWWPHAAVALNLFLMFTAITILSVKSPKNDQKPGASDDTKTETSTTNINDSFLETLKPIRTNKLSDNQCIRKRQMQQATKRMVVYSACYFLMLINSAATLAMIAPLPKGFWARAVILLSAALVIALPLWVWYRITETHMRFIYCKLPEVLDQEKRLKVAKWKHRWINGGKYGF